MATADEIAAFRLLIDEADDKLPYDDVALSSRLDDATSAEALASAIWREKAARLSALVNVSESGSSRNLGDMQANALRMAETFGKVDVTAPGGEAVRGTVMSRLTRP